MDDRISRLAALDTVRHLQTYKLAEGDEMILVDLADVQTELMMMPSAEQGQHGRWEFIGDQMFRCPECGQTFSKMLLEGWGTYLDRLYLPPCPICGADMIGEQDEY